MDSDVAHRGTESLEIREREAGLLIQLRYCCKTSSVVSHPTPDVQQLRQCHQNIRICEGAVRIGESPDQAPRWAGNGARNPVKKTPDVFLLFVTGLRAPFPCRTISHGCLKLDTIQSIVVKIGWF